MSSLNRKHPGALVAVFDLDTVFGTIFVSNRSWNPVIQSKIKRIEEDYVGIIIAIASTPTFINGRYTRMYVLASTFCGWVLCSDVDIVATLS